MNKTVIGVAVVLVIVIAGIFFLSQPGKTVNSFADCVKAGSPVLESNPRQCAYQGKTFTEALQTSKESMAEAKRKPMKQYASPPPLTINKSRTYTAVLDTNKGKISIALFAKEVPVTVNNFIFLSQDGFYDGSPFHRIIKGFMIQGGDPTGTGTGDPGYKFADEPITRDYKRGIVAMANSGPNTNGSQFFIMHADYALPRNYVIFGQVMDTESLQTVDTIAGTPVTSNGFGEASTPSEQILLQKVTIQEK